MSSSKKIRLEKIMELQVAAMIVNVNGGMEYEVPTFIVYHRVQTPKTR